MPALETQKDVFVRGENVLTIWPNSSAGYSITDAGRLRLVCDTGFNSVESSSAFTFNNSFAFCEVYPPAAAGAVGDCNAEMYVNSTTDGTDAGFTCDTITNRLYFRVRTGYFDGGETFVTYSGPTHRWWRIRITGGNILWDTSPDGTTWTNRRTAAAPAWATSATNTRLVLRTHRSSGTTNFAEFDNVSIIPKAATMSAPLGPISPTMTASVTRTATMSAPMGISPTLIAETIPIEVRSDPYILITDEDLNVVGDPISMVQSIEVVQKFNVPDAGSFKVPAYPEYMDVFQPGNRAVIIDEGKIFSAGPIEKPGGYEWSTGGEEEPGTVTVYFADDLSKVAERLTYPNPDLESWEQDLAYFEDNDNAELIIRELVIRNAGIWAKPDRIVPRLVLGPVAGVGSTVVCKTRFEPVTDVARALASAGGGLGFEVNQVDTELVFTVYAPEDKTKVARFSRGLGNLISVKYDRTKPTATTAIVGGDGEAETRTITERNDPAAVVTWGRAEKWVSAQSQDAGTGGLDQAGDNAVIESGEVVQLTTITIDSKSARYGKHYKMGDLVTVEVYPGIEVADVVREAKFTYTPEDGKRIAILVGTQEATRDPEWVRITNQLSSRLSNLERS